MAHDYRVTEKIFVLVIVISIVSLASSSRLRLDRFCAFNCNRGRGGLLCKCNAFHFAGKRTLHSEYSDKSPKDTLYDDLYDDKMNVDRRENMNNIDIPSADDQLSTAGNLQKADDSKIESTRLFIRWLLHRLDKEREETRHRGLYGYDNGGSSRGDLDQ